MTEFVECDSCKAKAQKARPKARAWNTLIVFVVELCDECLRRRNAMPDYVQTVECCKDGCDHKFEITYKFKYGCGPIATCPLCGARQEILYDDGYDEETGDESPYYYTEPIAQPTTQAR